MTSKSLAVMSKQIKQLKTEERKEKLKELRIELARSEMNTGKAKMKKKERAYV